MGPNRDLGMPKGRNGPIAHLISFPTGILACLDAGDYGQSSVMFWNQVGWCELYRGALGQRIRNAFIQVIPGIENADRLWVSVGNEVYWLPIAINPLKQEGYPFFSGSQIESSRITGSLKEVNKYWDSFKVFSENLQAGQQWVTLDYQVDTDPNNWHPVANDQGQPIKIETSPSQEVKLKPANTVEGRWLRYRMTLNTNNELITPRVKAIVIDAITRIPGKRAWNITFEISDEGQDLNGDQASQRATYYYNILRTWADSRQRAAPLIMQYGHEIYDQVYVVIEPPSLKPLEQRTIPDRGIQFIGSMMLREV